MDWGYGQCVERDRLAELLDTSGYASSACRHALLDGADFTVWDDSVPASKMLPAYERRERHTLAEDIPTLGFAAAIADLRSMGNRPVQVGQVKIVDPPYVFMLFLDAEGTSVVACFGVDQRAEAA